MYYPYLRGKQYELITVRESAPLLAAANFVPIIEPVKESLSGLQRSLDAVCDAGGRAVVVINPHHGDHTADGEDITALLRDHFAEHRGVTAGIYLSEEVTLDGAAEYVEDHEAHGICLIHAGFSDARGLAERLGLKAAEMCHVFDDSKCGTLYRRHFRSDHRILLRDGFKRRNNREYPPVEAFSDLHVTFSEAGMTGFGDFSIVGDEFSESGGPAYAVAIHLTFIDEAKDDEMYVYHFVSDRQDTPTDPAGKFSEALRKLVAEADKRDTKILATRAVAEFRELHARRHFPGLGYVKKLSMQHHIETLAEYFERGR